MTEFNIYCDETCHLENDHQTIMGFGAIVNPKSRTKTLCHKIKEIKTKHGLGEFYEFKWTKVSPSKLAFYIELLDFFLDTAELELRVLIVPDKTKLNHIAHEDSHDNFYYKMYYNLIKVMLEPKSAFNIYLDIKDTRSSQKILKLHEVLQKSQADFDKNIVRKVQSMHSYESQLMQLCDLLLGVIASANKGTSTSPAKLELVNHLRHKTGYSLTKSTLLKEKKLNIFIWKSKEELQNA